MERSFTARAATSVPHATRAVLDARIPAESTDVWDKSTRPEHKQAAPRRQISRVTQNTKQQRTEQVDADQASVSEDGVYLC